MDLLSTLIVSLRASALALDIADSSGDHEDTSSALLALADAAQAGRNVDAHMAEVAKLLQAGNAKDSDWADVRRRITEDHEVLQRPAAGPGFPAD